MFGLGTGEIVLILVVVLLIYGPDRLPGFARKLGKISRDMKNAAEDVKDAVRKEIQPPDDPTQPKS